MSAARRTRARRGNVIPIRANVDVADKPREEDEQAGYYRRIAQSFRRKVDEPGPFNGDRGIFMAEGFEEKLPCRNLRLIKAPIAPRDEWLDEMVKRATLAKRQQDFAESQWSLAYFLDGHDGGDRHIREDRRAETERALRAAIIDALRIPSKTLWDVRRKQDLVGRREWALKYRADWQAIIDEEEACIRAARKPRRKKEP